MNDGIDGTGHVFWREGGEINRVSVKTIVIWDDGCAYMGGLVYHGPRSGQNLCLIVCDDYWAAAWWDYVPYFVTVVGDEEWPGGVVIDPQRGNLIIKP